MSLYGPPDVEAAVVALLSREGGPLVVTRYPSEPADEVAGVVLVSATGGPRPSDRVVTAQTVLVECWHDDAAAAWAIASEAWARLADAPAAVVPGFDFKHVSSTLPNNNPDVNRPGMIRYQFLSTVHSRIVPLEAS